MKLRTVCLIFMQFMKEYAEKSELRSNFGKNKGKPLVLTEISATKSTTPRPPKGVLECGCDLGDLPVGP
jgi:hypothetical protein